MSDVDTSTHDDGGLLHSMYDYVTSKFKQTDPPKAPATSTEFANGAEQLMKPGMRKAAIDKAVEDAS